MSTVDMKSLKKLADLCRKIGITHFKNEMFEFTLSDVKPATSQLHKKANKINNTVSNNLDVITDEALSDEQLLFYSSMDPLAGLES